MADTERAFPQWLFYLHFRGLSVTKTRAFPLASPASRSRGFPGPCSGVKAGLYLTVSLPHIVIPSFRVGSGDLNSVLHAWAESTLPSELPPLEMPTGDWRDRLLFHRTQGSIPSTLIVAHNRL